MDRYLEYTSDLYQIYFEEDNNDIDDKGVNRNSEIFKKELYPIIEDKMNDKETINKLSKFTNDFISKNIERLSATGPIGQITFSGNTISHLYQIFDITDQYVDEINSKVLANVYPNKRPDQVMVNAGPLVKIFLISILIYGLKHKNQTIVSLITLLLSFAQYPITFNQFWKIGVKEDVMEYTIEHLSNQFAIRKHGNVMAFIVSMTESSINTHKDRIITDKDYTYYDLAIRIKNSFYSAFVNIANAYYDNFENNKTSHSQADDFEDGSLADVEGDTNKINELTSDIFNKFSSNNIEDFLVSIAAKGNGPNMTVDKEKLKSFLITIKAYKQNRAKPFFESILYLYFNDSKLGQYGLHSEQFLHFGINLYKSISLSKDEHSKNIKSILDLWQNISGLNDYTNRPATIISYRRAIFMYFILCIQQYN